VPFSLVTGDTLFVQILHEKISYSPAIEKIALFLEGASDKFLRHFIFYRTELRELVVEEWAVRDLNPRPFDYQSNAPPS
jgi:hypothetical protein